MKDGIYDFHFNVLDRDHVGTLCLRDNIADGGDDLHRVHGQVSRAGTNIMALFDVGRVAPDATTAAYTLKMFGTGTEIRFSVIGLAPLGLIVELHGTWKAPLAIAPDFAVGAEPASSEPE